VSEDSERRDLDAASADEKRARAYKAFLTARENYLRAAGWVPLAVEMPLEFANDPMKTVTMWAREHEVKRSNPSTLLSTKLALEQQEDLDGYTW
jgi:hypothetical protein